MSHPKNSNGAAGEALCLACGLCCNGVIFADVKLQPGDNATRLRELGLRLLRPRTPPSAAGPPDAPEPPAVPAPASAPQTGPQKFAQPCTAFDGCRCRIYAERPNYCRAFACALLQDLRSGRTQSAVALQVIRDARQRAEKVRRLLRALGDTDDHLALSVRFRWASKRLAAVECDDQTADLYGELTLAVHDLNCLLSRRFYPGAPQPEGSWAGEGKGGA